MASLQKKISGKDSSKQEEIKLSTGESGDSLLSSSLLPIEIKCNSHQPMPLFVAAIRLKKMFAITIPKSSLQMCHGHESLFLRRGIPRYKKSCSPQQLRSSYCQLTNTGLPLSSKKHLTTLHHIETQNLLINTILAKRGLFISFLGMVNTENCPV